MYTYIMIYIIALRPVICTCTYCLCCCYTTDTAPRPAVDGAGILHTELQLHGGEGQGAVGARRRLATDSRRQVVHHGEYVLRL